MKFQLLPRDFVLFFLTSESGITIAVWKTRRRGTREWSGTWELTSSCRKHQGSLLSLGVTSCLAPLIAHPAACSLTLGSHLAHGTHSSAVTTSTDCSLPQRSNFSHPKGWQTGLKGFSMHQAIQNMGIGQKDRVEGREDWLWNYAYRDSARWLHAAGGDVKQCCSKI